MPLYIHKHVHAYAYGVEQIVAFYVTIAIIMDRCVPLIQYFTWTQAGFFVRGGGGEAQAPKKFPMRRKKLPKKTHHKEKKPPTWIIF